MESLQKRDATVFVFGVDKIVETFIDLRVGEVGRESEHGMSSGGNGIGDGFVSVTCVPNSGPKSW